MDENKVSFIAITDRMKTVLGVQSEKEISKRMGRSPEFLSVRKSRGTIPYPEVVAFAISENISLDWLILGRGEKDVSGAAPAPVLELPATIVEVRVYDAENFGESLQDQAWYLPRPWLEDQGLSADNTMAVRVVGDSMESTMPDGQLVLVDLQPRTVDGVYLVRIGAGVYPRRIQHMVDGSVRLSCDNPAYAAEIVPATERDRLNIIGYCHSLVRPVR